MKKLNLFALGLISLSLASCGGEATEEEVNEEEVVVAETYVMETESAMINWTGDYMKGGEFDHNHQGVVMFNSGSIEVANGEIQSGTFELNMNTIDEPNAPMGEESRQKFLGHLKSEDYFHVEKYPTATVNLEKSTATNLVGTITVKGITMPFEAPATVAMSDSKDAIKITGDFALNFAPFKMEGIGAEGDPEYVSPKVSFSIGMKFNKK
jgi:polyisoprenoid-binding protein YceI